MNEKFYKIRHKETGLFFKPHKFTYRIPKNKVGKDLRLNEKGKVYTTKPRVDWIDKDKTKWEIVEYIMTEHAIIPFD